MLRSTGVGDGVGDGVGVGFFVGFGVSVGGAVGGNVGATLGASDAGKSVVTGREAKGGTVGRAADGTALDPGKGVTGVLMNGVEVGDALAHAATATVNRPSMASLVTRT